MPTLCSCPAGTGSPNYVTSMTLANVPSTKADLVSPVLRMCPHQWQDQYNLQEKGMTPMDMRSLQAFLEAIGRLCTPKKAHAQSGKRASHKNEAGAKQPSTGATKQAPKKVCFERSCKLCKKHGGVHTTHATKDCCRYEKDGMVKANFHTAKKAGKKPNPATQSFTQLSKKLDKLEKTLKKASHKSKKRCRDNSNSDSEYEIGLGSTRKLGLNLEKAVKWSKFTPPIPIKATPSELASDSNIVSDWIIASNQDIARSATLGNPVILHDSAILSDTATLSDPAILCNSTRLSNPATPSNPATFSNPSMLCDANDVRLTSPSQSEDVHNNNSTPTASNPLEGKTTAVIDVMRGNPKDGYTHLCSNKHCK
jgi:hypothetical protein